MCLFKMHTLEHSFRQDPAASEQQDISARETEDGYISFVCRKRTYGNYSPVLNGHVAQDLPSLAFFRHETDACPALRQNKRDREKESFFKGLQGVRIHIYIKILPVPKDLTYSISQD